MKHFVAYAALALAPLLGCKPRQGSTEEPRPGTNPDLEHGAVEREVDRDAVKDPARLARASERLSTLLQQHPEPFVALGSPRGSLTERPRAGKRVLFNFAMPGITKLSDAHVGRFAVRLSGGVQENIDIDRTDRPPGYTFAEPGPAMLMACAGPKGEAPSGSWFEVSHCTKILIDVADSRGRLDPTREINVTGETGLPIDIVPLMSPFGLATGSTLPVSFHFMNEEEAGIEVAARRPDGTIDRQVTDGSGMAQFVLSQPGRWVIRMVTLQAQGERVGELVFEIPEVRP